MAVTTTKTNKPLNPRGNDQSPKGYNRAELYSGKALDFDGVNDYVDCGTTTNADVVSFAMWVNLDTYSGTSGIIGRNEGDANDHAQIWVYQSNLTFFVGSGSGYEQLQTTTPNTGEWFHLVCVADDSTKKQQIYINGVLDVERTFTLSLDDTDRTLIVGAINTSAYRFNGKLNGVKQFNTALTAAQVADLYNNPEKIVPTGVADSALKLWLPMQEGAGTTAYDGSGNGNHGTISGATWTHGVGAPVAQTAVIDWNKQSYLNGVGGDDYYINNNFANFQTQTEVTFYAEFICQGETAFDEEQQLIDWGYNNGFRLRLDSSNQPQLINSGGSNILSSSTAINFNEFNRLAGKGDASGLKIFLNGTQIASNSTALILPGSSQTSIAVGANTSTSENFKGVIPEAKVWTSSLTDAQLESLTAGTTNPEDYTSGALAHWTGASEYEDQVGSYDLTAIGSPVRFLAPQGLTGGRDIFNALFNNVRKQGALNLDGLSRASVHENASIDLSDCSLEAWVCPLPESGSGWQTIFSKVSQANLQIYLNAGDVLAHYNSTTAGGVLYGTAFNKNEWHHIVCVEDGTDVLTYVDGVLRTTKTISLQMDSDGDFSIGSKPGILADEITAQIAQPRIYNRALTAEEVERNYNAGKNIYK